MSYLFLQSPCLPLVDDNGEGVWGSDPVHPLPHGFRLLVDMFETEIENLQGKTRKRAGSILQPPSKRTKPATRPPGSASRLPPPSEETMAAGSEVAAAAPTEVAEATSEEDSEATEAEDRTEKIVVCFFSCYNKNLYKKP
jgi:hypothetical protein